jgi:ribA/ribD-fused uncharacterized protein
MSDIAFTKVKLPFGWLGNMSPFPVTALGKEWRTTEALFQAMRFEDEEIRKAIREHKSPMGAKLVAKGRKEEMVVEPLSDQDVENMEFCLRLKIDQHPELVEKLIATDGRLIVEDVTSRGRRGSNTFWGAINTGNGWDGDNKLGELWMKLRDELTEAA